MSRAKDYSRCDEIENDLLYHQACDGVVLITLWQVVHHVTRLEKRLIKLIRCACVFVKRDNERGGV